MADPDVLRRAARAFVALTDQMLISAQSGHWDTFFQAHDAREDQMALLIGEAGNRLLIELPEFRSDFETALSKSLQIDVLARTRSDFLGENLAAFQARRRLRSTYR